MALRFRNSLGRITEEFHPIKEGEVRMYTCGPTVWNYVHIGNLRTFVFEDVLRRYLKFKGYRVNQVMNITDVEDKIIKGMHQSGKSRKELCDFYEAAFMQDIAKLGVERAETYPRATEHIAEMVALVNELMKKGYAYKAQDGSVYFAVSKFENYGALSGIRPSELKAGARVKQDTYEKEEANDFALWKSWDPDDGEVYWETELGKGRPGWHIECSAMSMKYLGESFDIHTGGLDNRFPHHENEIAQSEAATGKQFVRFWLHSELLQVEGAEMHKSVGNVVYLKTLLDSGLNPLTIRQFLVSTRYREKSNLSDAAFEQAKAEQGRLQELVFRLRSVPEDAQGTDRVAENLLAEFEFAMDDDLNTPAAFVALFAAAKEANGLIDEGKLSGKEARLTLEALERINGVLGVLDFRLSELTPKQAFLILERESARKRRDFAESDRLRRELLTEGISVEDTPTGTDWKSVRAG